MRRLKAKEKRKQKKLTVREMTEQLYYFIERFHLADKLKEMEEIGRSHV